MTPDQLIHSSHYVALILLVGMMIHDWVKIDRLERENKDMRAQIAKFDGDGDGRIGGGRKRRGF